MKKPKPTEAVLHLNLKREYFAAIAAGEKTTEYRDITPYWKKRLEGRKYKYIQFRNGYATKALEMQIQMLGLRKTTLNGHPYYAIRLGRILKLKRWKA